MIYTTYQDMARVLRRSLWKIPQDIDLIVGIPRSGMIAALMLSELLNKRCMDLDTFCEGRLMSCGGRGRLIAASSADAACMKCKVLVLDDTVFHGNAMRKARERLSGLEQYYDILYGCVFAEGEHVRDMVDIFLDNNYVPGERWYFYEWNILHHYGKRTQHTMWDIDGLLCKEPPDERLTGAYEAYLPAAVPMVIPTTTIGAFVTYRLEKYRAVTEQWLEGQHVRYERLLMFDAPDYATRKSQCGPAHYKAALYGAAEWACLFYESSARQAETIHLLTKKPVFCYDNGVMYK